MPVVGSGRDQSARAQTRDGRELPVPGALWRFVRNLTLIFFALPALVLLTGFLWFLWRMPNHEIALASGADGIVVLTGGASRVTDALELLASKRGQRLLISGVHRATGPEEIARVAPEFQTLFACCVDLDRAATNTTGKQLYWDEVELYAVSIPSVEGPATTVPIAALAA